MDPQTRTDVGHAVQRRIVELGSTTAKIASAAGVSPSTIRNLVTGRHWPNEVNRRAIELALGWNFGDIEAQLGGSPQPLTGLEDYSRRDLLLELVRREHEEDRLLGR